MAKTTNSRYDYMKEGNVRDSVSESLYPDPLSLSYLDLHLSEKPVETTLGDSDIAFFWYTTQNVYGVPAWDDVVLTLNGIPHKNFLKLGDKIYFPNLSDIRSSFGKQR